MTWQNFPTCAHGTQKAQVDLSQVEGLSDAGSPTRFVDYIRSRPERNRSRA